MKFLGVDYGTKRIGIALSDEGGTLAFPKAIIENNDEALGFLRGIIIPEEVGEIVIGESVDQDGKPNPLSHEINIFKQTLKDSFKLPVNTEKEFMTTIEARRYAQEGTKVDASAAALILQRYLDKINNKKINDHNR